MTDEEMTAVSLRRIMNATNTICQLLQKDGMTLKECVYAKEEIQWAVDMAERIYRAIQEAKAYRRDN